MLNWLRGKFGKGNNTNTNFTITDDDKFIELFILANKHEDSGTDEDIEPDSFQRPQDLALYLNGAKSLENVFNEAVDTPITPEAGEPSQSSGELSGNLESGRAEVASAITKEPSLSALALKLKKENPTLKFTECQAAAKAQSFYNTLLKDGKKIIAFNEDNSDLTESTLVIPEIIQSLFPEGRLPLLESDFMDIFMNNMDKLSVNERSIFIAIKNSYGDGFNSASESNNN
jgi:hypothetical protein